MFTHQGDTRTFEHNLKIAALLSFVAGVVNVVGFISVHVLTTNVTGHFAFFADDMLRLNIRGGFIFFLYIFTFFMGSFVSNVLVETMYKKIGKHTFIIPIALEITVLLTLSFAGDYFYKAQPHAIALCLLFIMGLQNSLVTKISNAVVRTTHLTGLFTDLGIETSQLFFYTSGEQRKKLSRTIGLRLRIIVFFFTGGVLGGLLYAKIGFYSLLIPSAILSGGLIYDAIAFKIETMTKKQEP